MECLTLAFLLKEKTLCLGYKKRGFGEGLYNGYGGKIEGSETVKECAVREIEEESLVKVAQEDLMQVAKMEFIFENGTHLEVHTFVVTRWIGEPKETEEMKPSWFLLNKIPYKEMWEDDQYWLPRVLLGEKLVGEVWFDHTQRHIKEMKWEAVEKF